MLFSFFCSKSLDRSVSRSVSKSRSASPVKPARYLPLSYNIISMVQRRGHNLGLASCIIWGLYTTWSTHSKFVKNCSTISKYLFFWQSGRISLRQLTKFCSFIFGIFKIMYCVALPETENETNTESEVRWPSL